MICAFAVWLRIAKLFGCCEQGSGVMTVPIWFVPAGSGEFGERPTTSEGSAAAAAVDAGFTAAGPFVPSVIFHRPGICRAGGVSLIRGECSGAASWLRPA